VCQLLALVYGGRGLSCACQLAAREQPDKTASRLDGVTGGVAPWFARLAEPRGASGLATAGRPLFLARAAHSAALADQLASGRNGRWSVVRLGVCTYFATNINLEIYSRWVYVYGVQELIQGYRALSDPTRLRILHLLGHQSLCVCHLQDILHLPRVPVSQRLD
jgi:hypothetical protein